MIEIAQRQEDLIERVLQNPEVPFFVMETGAAMVQAGIETNGNETEGEDEDY